MSHFVSDSDGVITPRHYSVCGVPVPVHTWGHHTHSLGASFPGKLPAPSAHPPHPLPLLAEQGREEEASGAGWGRGWAAPASLS